MKRMWRIRDLIDLEYFLHEDDDADDKALVRRDRDIYLKEVAPVLKKEGESYAADRKNVIRLWLDVRRRMAKALPGGEALLPGKLFVEFFSLLLVGFLVAGLILGIILAFSVLVYRGMEPVNVSTYFGIFVFLQIILVFALIWVSLLRRRIPSLGRISVLQPLIGMLLAGMFRRVATHAANKLSGRQRKRLTAVTGILKSRKRIYGQVFYWPIFILAQVMGIGFNLGVLAGSTLRIVSLDLAFGWQSTIQFSSQAVYLFVKTVALPWSWIISHSTAYPTYEQIEGSRMVLKDGIYGLATPDLVSWWPFLLLAVFCYGLVPRVILFGVGILARKRATEKVAFNHAACNLLMRRLNNPLLETDDPMKTDDGSAQAVNVFVDAIPRDAGAAEGRGHEAIILVPDDIWGQDKKELEGLLKKTLAMGSKQWIKISGDVEEDKRPLSVLADFRQMKSFHPVIIIQEAWQPPIAETLLYMRKLRDMVGSEIPIHVFLIGKPTQKDRISGAEPAEWQTWKQAIQVLGDPFFEINGVRDS